MATEKQKCIYCGSPAYHGDVCANCYRKRALIREIQTRVRTAKKHGLHKAPENKGCCYCKQGTEWGLCDEFGEAKKPYAIRFCPMCGKKLKKDGEENGT